MKKSKTVLIIVSAIVVIMVAGLFIVYPNTLPSPLRSTAEHYHRILFNDRPGITFTDVADRAGIHYKHFSGSRTNQLPEDMGSGAAWFDYDRDGWQDLFIANISGPLSMSDEERENSPAHSMLYHNNGDGTFTDVTEQAGVVFRGFGMGVAAADYNNDGWPDLFLSNYGHNILLKNKGDGTFKEVTRSAGLYNFEGFWTDGQWGDYDRDGYLDLYVTGYLKYKDISSVGEGKNRRRMDIMVPFQLSPGPFESQENLLFHNNGDGTFTERAAQLNVRDLGGKSLAASWCDFNNDHWPDLMIANDVSRNTLYLNYEGRKFIKESFLSDNMSTRGSMGLAVGDVDEDLDMDYFVTNWLKETNGLLVNQTTPKSGRRLYHFFDKGEPYGVAASSRKLVGWGTAFYDFDNDSHLDLFVANGSTNPQKDDSLKLEPMPSQFFWNRGLNKGFKNITTQVGKDLGKEIVGRGTAFADYDNDGDIDIFIVDHSHRGILLQNQGGNARNWTKISLQGTESNHSAIGTRVKLTAGGQSYIREVGVQPSYMSDNSLVLHFGLGDNSNIDSLEVAWPAGGIQTFGDLPVNKTIRIEEGRQQYNLK